VSPRFQGRLPQDNGTSDPLSARAATLFVKIDQAPQQPVASQLTLNQQLSPASGAREGEPVIRTLTLVMEGGDGNRLTLPGLTGPAALPAGMQARPDGEQQQERFLAKGALRFERQWRQALTATAPGDYLLPAITLPWFNTRSGRIEYARLPATPLRIEAGAQAQQTFTEPNHESLHWAIWALLLRALWQRWPRWHAFYRLQRALRREDANHARAALLAWASLRWPRRHTHLSDLPCRHAPALAAGLAALDRACFATQATPVDHQRPWQGLASPLCAYETFAIAYGLRQLARLGH